MRVSVAVPLLALLVATPTVASEIGAGQATVARAAGGELGGLLAGRVVVTETPLQAATVYLYRLADTSLHKALTDARGSFGFDGLPAGLYKVVAFKPGFLPAVVVLTRAAADMRQYLDLELEPEPESSAPDEDFWSLRGEIPRDVLRDIEIARYADPAVDAGARQGALIAAKQGGGFHTAMQALAGMRELGEQPARLTGGRIDVEGSVGGLAIGLRGDYRQLATSADGRPLATLRGESRDVRFSLANEDSTRLGLRTLSNTLPGDPGGALGGDFEHVQVFWSQRVGASGQSDFAAQYTEESNFYRQGWTELVGVPAASRTWQVSGSYATRLDDRTSLQTGMRYRLREDPLTSDRANLFLPGAAIPSESLDVFARGGSRINPSWLVEYGLYATQVDGSVSLMPRGGVVVQLADAWQLGASLGQRLRDEPDDRRGDFIPTLYDPDAECELGETACYRLYLARQSEQDAAELRFGVAHRRFGDTLRVYFNEDVFNHLESLYLVRGDQLSELQLGITEELSPRVVTTLSASLGSGGRGELIGQDKRRYRNAVRYLVTSLDTRFSRTETGVFLAFHRLEQALRPTSAPSATAGSQVAVERLQLLVSQNLDVLLDLPAEWAVELNMELSRGGLFASSVDPEELRRQVTGGVSVSF